MTRPVTITVHVGELVARRLADLYQMSRIGDGSRGTNQSTSQQAFLDDLVEQTITDRYRDAVAVFVGNEYPPLKQRRAGEAATG